MAMPTNHKGVFLSKHRPDGHTIPLCIGMCLFRQRGCCCKNHIQNCSNMPYEILSLIYDAHFRCLFIYLYDKRITPN